MKCTATREIYAYWNDIRGNHTAPFRNEIDPAKLRHILPDLFILGENGEGSPIFRLAGTRFCARFGKEFRNTAFGDLWQTESGEHPSQIAKGVMRHESPVLFDLVGVNGRGEQAARFEMILLPLRPVGDEPLRLLGGMTLQEGPALLSPLLSQLSLERSRLLKMKCYENTEAAQPRSELQQAC